MDADKEFRKVYQQYFQPLHRYAFTLVEDTEWAQDIVQDVFLAYLRKIQAPATILHPQAYLYRSVYNTAITQIRKKASEQKVNKHYPAGDAMESHQDFLIQDEQAKQLNKNVQEVLHQLPEQCRTAFVKSRKEGKRYQQIAMEMDISVKTVEAHISKALKKIKELVRGKDWLLSLIITIAYGTY